MKVRFGISVAFGIAFALMDDEVALLQLSQHASLTVRNETISVGDQVQKIMTTKDAQHASVLVEDLANSAVQGKVLIDDGAKAALNAMKTTLENSQELINAAHTTDQNLRNTHATRAAECLYTYNSAKTEDAGEAAVVAGKHTGHVSCRDRLAVDDADMVTKCNDLDFFISQINPPCTVPGRPGIEGYWSNYKQYYDAQFPVWQEKEQACAAAEQKRAATDAECDGLQRDFETNFCFLRLEMVTTCSEYTQCHTLAEKEFNDVMVATTAAEVSRKIEWTAIEKIKCYIDVLVSDDDNDTKQAALTACKDLEPDTSHLTLIAPTLPVPPPCDLSAVSVYPCTDGFVTSRYDGLMDVETCEACTALPNHLINGGGGSCTAIEDDGEGWSPDSQRYTVAETIYHSYDQTMKTVEKTFDLLPGINYKWTAVIDTWASVDNEAMRFCAISDEFGEVCEDFSSRTHNNCDNGFTEYAHGFGKQVGSPGSGEHDWIDCFKDFEKTITGPAGGSVTIRMFMDINQARSDEAWGWHDMKFEPTSCPPVRTPFAMDATKQVCSKADMLAAGWSWTGCPVDHHGGDSLCNGIWCHSQEQMHLKVPPLAGTGTCTATWRNDYTNNGADGFVRLMKNGEQIGEALAQQTQTVTFTYAAGDELELWEGFAIAKADENWIQCDTGAAAAAVVSAPVNVNNALQVCGSKQGMLDAGWTWTGCAYNDHGGDSLCNGIWCHSEKEMHLHVPMSGGPSTCTATWRNDYSNTASNGFVRLMKNGQQLGEARANEEKTVTFTYADGDEIEIWEGFAIAKATDNWLQCS